MGTVANMKVEPMVVYFGSDRVQVQTITCVADVADSLDGKYFFFTDSAGAGHYCWFNTSGGAATDPSLAGYTAHVVALTTGASANAVASATQAVMDAVSGFDATVSSAVVTLTHTATGYAQAARDGNAGLSFSVTTYGETAADVGCIDGDIELAIDTQRIDLTCHAEGTNILGKIPTGRTISVTMNLKETTVAQLKKMLVKMGGSYTPVGASGTEIVGIGTGADFVPESSKYSPLRLHPKVLAAGDRSRDIYAPKAFPLMEGLTFSGESVFTIPITFECYVDQTLNSKANILIFGDNSQALT